MKFSAGNFRPVFKLKTIGPFLVIFAPVLCVWEMNLCGDNVMTKWWWCGDNVVVVW